MVVRRRGNNGLALAFAVMVLAGCGSQQAAASAPPSAGAAALNTSEGNRSSTPLAVPATTATEPTIASSTTASSTTEPSTTVPVSECEPNASTAVFDEPPPTAIESIQQAAADPAFGTDVSISIWVDGWGEVLAVNPNLRLAPASNQKLLVAIAAHNRLDMSARFRTTVDHAESTLVLRAGGDPTLTSANIDDLVRQLFEGGVTSAERLVIDVAAYPQLPSATGWLDWQIPTYVGPLSGLMIDDNRWTKSDVFVADPAQGNGERVLDRMTAGGISVASNAVPNLTVATEVQPALGRVVAEHESATFDELVRSMLWTSDNQTADLLLMELGRDANGIGTLSTGAEAVDDVLSELCVDVSGTVDDGSGLSRGNQRSAREFQEILRAVRQTPAGQRIQDQLPVGGISGTMENRFGGSDAGRVAAKTGTIIGGRSLSGYATTDSGREVVFSIVVNGEPELATASLGAIDRLVTAIIRIAE